MIPEQEVEITGVHVDETGERPRLMLDVIGKDGKPFSFELHRDDARMLSQTLGRHPVVEAFFRDGDGLQ